MIVSYKDEGWHIVTQRAHGILAGELAANWKVSERPERWFETLLAITEHDDAENELDGERLITEVGGPLDYSMKSFDQGHCERLSSCAIIKSRYIALLTSMHMQFLYGNENNDEAKAYLKMQEELRGQWRNQLNIDESETRRIYRLMEWCDACSLLLCKNDLPPENRSVEISKGPNEKTYYLSAPDSDTVEVDPWPFESPSFTVHAEKRILNQLQFDSSATFREAFVKSPVIEIKWRIEPKRG